MEVRLKPETESRLHELASKSGRRTDDLVEDARTSQATPSEMKEGPGFVLHPGAAQDITEIWDFIAADNPQAARRVREEILDTISPLSCAVENEWRLD